MKTSAKRKIAVMSAALAVVLLGSCAVSYQDQEEQVPDWLSALVPGTTFNMYLASGGEEVTSRTLGSIDAGATETLASVSVRNANASSVSIGLEAFDDRGAIISSSTLTVQYSLTLATDNLQTTVLTPNGRSEFFQNDILLLIRDNSIWVIEGDIIRDNKFRRFPSDIIIRLPRCCVCCEWVDIVFPELDPEFTVPLPPTIFWVM